MEIIIRLIGIMALWLGIMKVGEHAGLIEWLSKKISPFMRLIFPEVPAGHPAQSSMVMNFAANMLGLDNAATPFGLKAMEDLQSINPSKSAASDAQIMFLVLNTSGLTLIPVSVIALRAANGASEPTEVFIPILLATTVATIFGLLIVSIRQGINLFQPRLILTIAGFLTFYRTFNLGLISTSKGDDAEFYRPCWKLFTVCYHSCFLHRRLAKGNQRITVVDNGRGIPVDTHKKEGKSALEIIMTVLHAGGKFDKSTYKVSGGLHGVGASVVNALSEWCSVEVSRDGKIYLQEYQKGLVTEPVREIGTTTEKRHQNHL